jgi:hypothetical protein
VHERESLLGKWFGAASLILSLGVLGCGGPPVETSTDRAGVRISAQLSQLSGTCPHLHFKMGSKRVGTDDSSAFVDRSCSDLREGEAIEVEGGWDSDGSLVARKVRRQHEPPEFEIRGALSELNGTCPNLTFTVGTERLMTDASTRFRDQPCSSLRNGQLVEVHGIHRADGSALVRELEPNREPERFEVLGTVKNHGGSCPSLTFFIGGDAIITSAETRFKSLSCGDLTDGRFVEVEGVRQADGRILAGKVEVEDELEEQEVEISGTLSGLSGTCPDVSFIVQGRPVHANRGTVFESLSCAAVRDGLAVEVKGAAQPDGSVLALRIKAER